MREVDPPDRVQVAGNRRERKQLDEVVVNDQVEQQVSSAVPASPQSQGPVVDPNLFSTTSTYRVQFPLYFLSVEAATLLKALGSAPVRHRRDLRRGKSASPLVEAVPRDVDRVEQGTSRRPRTLASGVACRRRLLAAVRPCRASATRPHKRHRRLATSRRRRSTAAVRRHRRRGDCPLLGTVGIAPQHTANSGTDGPSRFRTASMRCRLHHEPCVAQAKRSRCLAIRPGTAAGPRRDKRRTASSRSTCSRRAPSAARRLRTQGRRSGSLTRGPLTPRRRAGA